MPNYVLIVDAGSSGSRLRMYNMTKGADAIEPTKKDEGNFETEPGLSAYANKPSAAGPSLKHMIKAALAYIPKEEHSKTPLWVKATAGMRILPQSVLKTVFGEVDTYLESKANCPFNFITSEVLGGEEEAVFAYLSMNFVLGITDEKDEVGIMDMGGASMQIAHKPEGFILASEFSYYTNNIRQSVYAKSLIKFGLVTAIERAQEIAVSKASKGATKVPFPCYLEGHNETAKVRGRTITFVGTGNSAECSDLTESLLHRDYECLMHPCPIMGVHMSPFAQEKRFYGIANYFYIANGLGLIGWNEQKAISPGEIEAAAKEFCGKGAAKAQKEEGSPWKYRKNHCFGGLYLSNIVNAYGFPKGSKSITFARTLKGVSADWSMGAALYETQFMPLDLQSRIRPCKAPAASQKWAAGGPLVDIAARSDMGPAAWLSITAVAAAALLLIGLAARVGPCRRAGANACTRDAAALSPSTLALTPKLASPYAALQSGAA